MLIHGLLALPELATLPSTAESGHTTLCFDSQKRLISVDSGGIGRQVYPAQASIIMEVLAASNNGSWVRPSGATWHEFVLVGAGGGGGGGAQQPSGTTAWGGTGGCGGAWMCGSMPGSILPATVPYVVSLGGSGGVNNTAVNAAGYASSGGNGGVCILGATSAGSTSAIAVAPGGAGGPATTITGGSGGAPTPQFNNGSASTSLTSEPSIGSAGSAAFDALSPSAANPRGGGTFLMGMCGCGGGGGGGGTTSAGGATAGGAGGLSYGSAQAGATAGTSGGPGTDGSSWTWFQGGGGGGGGGNTSLPGGQGGNGGQYGGGGGGGGGSIYKGGSGGKGGDGCLIVVSYR